MAQLIYPKLSYKLTGLFYKIHNELGRFRNEKQYCEAFEKLLLINIISYQREKISQLNFMTKKYKATFLILL